MTWILILLNCYFFWIELKMPTPDALQEFMVRWAMVPSRFWSDPMGDSANLVTAIFLHGGWMHIIGNMLFLHIFGDNVEDRLGHVRYLFFYLLLGILANLAQAYLSATSKLPLLGASGAIAGVLGAYFFFHPYARVVTLIPFGIFSRIVEIPAFIFLGLWFLIQAIQGTASLGVRTMQDVGGVAWWAHASGFVGGLLLGPAFSYSKRKTRSRVSFT